MGPSGSDCCATCWFNVENEGSGSDYTQSNQSSYCSIRDFTINNPDYTYCANHPYRSPEQLSVPIGPVFIGEHHNRRMWLPSMDGEAIRATLLDLLQSIEETPRSYYHLGMARDDVVIWQLGEFKDARAIPDLERIASFDPTAEHDDVLRTNRAFTVGLAKQALKKIRKRK